MTHIELVKFDSESKEFLKIFEKSLDPLSGIIEVVKYFKDTKTIVVHSQEHLLKFKLQEPESESEFGASLELTKHAKISRDTHSQYSCNMYFDQSTGLFFRFRLNPEGHRHYILETYDSELNQVSMEHCGNVWHYD